MPTAYSYLRFSSKKQELGDSLKRQKEERDKWLSANPEYKLAPEDFNIEDLAVSAFKTKRKKNQDYVNPLDALLSGSNLDPKQGNLGIFLALAEKKEVPIEEGDILILETLDRFSRLPAAYAISALTRLLTAGLNVLLLTPYPNLVTLEGIKKTDEIVMLIVRMQSAYEYSLSIQRRVSAAWDRKREKARNGTPITKQLPAWLHYDEQSKQIKLSDEPAKAIRYIFQRTLEGIGQNKLVKEMNQLFPAITAKKGNENPKWNTSYISKILDDKSTYGVYQPYKFDENRERKKDGSPIANYFPAVITEDTFNAAQYAKSIRKREKKTSAAFVNILEGLVVNALDGSVCHIQTTRQKREGKPTYIQRRLQSYKHRNGIKNSCGITIDYFALERLVFRSLTETRFDNLADKANTKVDKELTEAAMAGLLDQIKQTEDELKLARLPKQITALANLLEEQETKLSSYQERLKSIGTINVEQSVDWPFKHDWEFHSLLDDLDNLSEEEAISFLTKLKPKVQSAIRTIYVYPVKKENRQVACVGLVLFTNGDFNIVIHDKAKLDGMDKYIIPHIQYLDRHKNPILSLLNDGLVVFFKEGSKWAEGGQGMIVTGGVDEDSPVFGYDDHENPLEACQSIVSAKLRAIGVSMRSVLDAIENLHSRRFDVPAGFPLD